MNRRTLHPLVWGSLNPHLQPWYSFTDISRQEVRILLGEILCSGISVYLPFPLAAGLGFGSHLVARLAFANSICARTCAYTSSISACVAGSCSSPISVNMETILKWRSLHLLDRVKFSRVSARACRMMSDRLYHHRWGYPQLRLGFAVWWTYIRSWPLPYD